MNNDPYNALAAAIILQAYKDMIKAAKNGDYKTYQECLEFFSSDWYGALSETIDVRQNAVNAKIKGVKIC